MKEIFTDAEFLLTVGIIAIVCLFAATIATLTIADKQQERFMAGKQLCYQMIEGTTINPHYQYQPCSKGEK